MLTVKELRELRDREVFGRLRKRTKTVQKQKVSDVMSEFEMSVAPKEKKASEPKKIEK